jgi:peptidoglycan-associated lipoprotein
MIDRISNGGVTARLALIWLATVIAGCATSASLRPEIDTMKAALAEAKAQGAEMSAPEAYAHAEACVDWLLHEATQFDHFGKPRDILGRCRAAFASLKQKLSAVQEAKVRSEPVAPPPAPKPEAPPPAAPERAAEAAKEIASPLKPVFFDFDRAVIRSDARAALDDNARWLKANPTATVVIEGHCDERGTREYNLGLGDRRAKAARDYLVTAGIEPNRIKTISYGKERPFVLGHDESAWKWNRRAHFVLQ